MHTTDTRAPAPPSTGTAALPGLSVMVVDDYPDAAESAAVLLRICGHRVVVATTGRAALDLAAGDPLDVVVLDIALPDLNGWEVARWLREQTAGEPKRPFLVAMSGCVTEEDIARSAAAGIDLHLAKGCEPGILIGILRRFQETLGL